MKIVSQQFLPAKIATNHIGFSGMKKYDNQSDTFQKSNKLSISFKGGQTNLAKIAKEVLNNPDLSAKLTAFLTSGFLALVSLSKESQEKIDTNEPTESMVESFLENLNNESEIDESTQQLTENTEEHLLENDNNNDSVFIQNQTEEIPTESENLQIQAEEKEAIKFPKKVGRLTIEQESLKNLVETIKVSKEDGIKLYEICKNILDKNFLIKSDKNIIIKDIIKKLSDSSISPETVIEEYYAIFSAENNTDAHVIENERCGIKIIDRVDLNNIPGYKPKTDSANEENSDTANIASENKKLFKIPGTNNRTTSENLKKILLDFEHELTTNPTEKFLWRSGINVSKRVYAKDVLKEICKYLPENEDDYTEESYKNIREEDADTIADIINSEPRFNKFFTLHGSVRFLDRYLDFNKGNLQEQCEEKLNALEDLLNRALADKGIHVEQYENYDYKGNKYLNPNIIIDPKEYGTYYIEQLGSYPIKLGICENQPIRGYYNRYNKSALICTIFSPGV